MSNPDNAPSRSKPPVGDVKGKKKQVRRMFDDIAPRYDLLNRILSGGIDQLWRRRLTRQLVAEHPERVLDVATGTADLAIMAAKLGVSEIVGVDIAEQMLEVGRAKIRDESLSENITLQRGDAERLPFSDAQFDAAMVAFGVRNFEDLDRGLEDMCRVLRPGGSLYVLEFSRPHVFPIKQLYGFYGRYVLPAVGRLVSGDPAAYTYLPESIAVFPEGEEFLETMRKAGFMNARQDRRTFGIATIYSGIRG